MLLPRDSSSVGVFVCTCVCVGIILRLPQSVVIFRLLCCVPGEGNTRTHGNQSSRVISVDRGWEAIYKEMLRGLHLLSLERIGCRVFPEAHRDKNKNQWT